MLDGHQRIITFDCYGTLIRFDLDGVVRRIVGPRALRHGIDVEQIISDLRIIRFYATTERYARYQDVLRRTLEIACMRHGVPYDAEFGDALLEEVRRFQPFEDVHQSLLDLKALGYQAALLTNSDDDLILHHVRAIDVEFDYVVTAESSRAYKPRQAAFDNLFRVIDRPRHLVTHAAQGWEYDILPTTGMGIHRVWINRAGLPGNEAFAPYDEVSNVRELVTLMERRG